MKGIVFLGDRKAEVREFPVPEPAWPSLVWGKRFKSTLSTP